MFTTYGMKIMLDFPSLVGSSMQNKISLLGDAYNSGIGLVFLT